MRHNLHIPLHTHIPPKLSHHFHPSVIPSYSVRSDNKNEKACTHSRTQKKHTHIIFNMKMEWKVAGECKNYSNCPVIDNL